MDRLQTGAVAWRALLEKWLESERDQLAHWLPVWLGAGIGLWFLLPDVAGWRAVILAGAGLVVAGMGIGWQSRAGRCLVWMGLAMAAGCALVWGRSVWVAAPVLTRPVVSEVSGTILQVSGLPSNDGVRVLLKLGAGEGLPARVRVSVSEENLRTPLHVGERIVVRARLMPPPGAAIPGAYDFARVAWFQQLGATGKALGPPRRLDVNSGEPTVRERLSTHVRAQLSGSAGGIAAAFASGDRAGISPEDDEAMRASGLTHLLSISGLHITAVVAAAMVLALRLLALSPWLALRWPLLLISAAFGASAGVGYTLLTGAEVPTVRSCIAALLVLIGLALGREAMTLRLVATGALIVLLVWPEAMVGPSFQLSFAAITAIVALHELPWVKAVTQRRDENMAFRLGRLVFELLLTGLAVELVLAPIALFHFHKSGVYGALANIIAIPLTTFFIMPAEALALAFDVIGLGAPFWWVTGQGLDLLLWLARFVAAQPGAMAAMPSMPVGAFALMVTGGLWLLLWKTRARLAGLPPVVAGFFWAAMAPVPDLLITGDGRHMALRTAEGGPVGLLRGRAGDYVRSTLGEATGESGELPELDGLAGTNCGPDMCLATIKRGGRDWSIAATRSSQRLPWEDLIRTCAAVDIIVSDRMLPRGCAPNWLKADKLFLKDTGGLAINLSTGRVQTVRLAGDAHPWITNGQ